jgi:sugar-specific transcriptional regulator TrmB
MNLTLIKGNIKQAGLTENEAQVYLALLEMGARPAGTISRKTGLHRRVIYDTTDRLIKKGLIGYIVENNRKIFHASNPNRLIEIVEAQKQNIFESLGEMALLFNQSKEKQREDTMVFKGKSGLKSVFEDQIEQGKEIFIIGGSEVAYELMEFYFNWFDKRRKSKKIPIKIIFNSPLRLKIPKIPLSEIRFLPEKYSSPLSVNIYGDRTAIIFWDKEKPLAILIKQKEIAEGYKKYFDLIWKVSKK